MIRRTLFIPETLDQRLLIAAKLARRSVSQVVRELLNAALAHQEQAQLKRLYAGLRELQGIGPHDVTDASTTINEVLYGENGAWRGTLAPDHG